MQVELVPIKDLGVLHVEQWRALGREVLVTCPYFEPEYLIPAARHLPGGEEINLLIVREGSAMLGALPLVRYKILGRAARACWGTSSGVLGEMADLRAPLLQRESAERALRAMLAFLHKTPGGGPGLLDLGKLPFDEPFRSIVLSACDDLGMPFKIGDSYERGVIIRRFTNRYWEAAIGRKRLHDVERRQRGLERELGGPVVVNDRSEDPAFISDFIGFESKGWKGQVESGGRGIGISRGAELWFKETFGELQRQGRVVFIDLTVCDTVVYMGVCLASNHTLFCYRDAYDERWARFGTGFLGRLANMEQFDKRSELDFLDSTTIPKYETTTRLFPDRRTISSLLIATGGFTDRSLIKSLPHVQWVREQAIRASAWTSTSAQKIRSRVKS